MKHTLIPSCVASAVLLVGCSSTRTVLAPVGPNPAALAQNSNNGKLEVYSAVEECRDGNEFDIGPAWYEHTDYSVYDMKGQRVQHVFNSAGHYDEAPSDISLPAAKYVLRAEAEGFVHVEVPIVIERGRTTRVHLDAEWKPPVDASKSELVTLPNSYAVGWRALSPGTLDHP